MRALQAEAVGDPTGLLAGLAVSQGGHLTWRRRPRSRLASVGGS